MRQRSIDYEVHMEQLCRGKATKTQVLYEDLKVFVTTGLYWPSCDVWYEFVETETPPEQFQQQLEADVSPLYQQVEVNCFFSQKLYSDRRL